jgi:hypothetical protein
MRTEASFGVGILLVCGALAADAAEQPPTCDQKCTPIKDAAQRGDCFKACILAGPTKPITWPSGGTANMVTPDYFKRSFEEFQARNKEYKG